ncbi:uncharacterized protein LOC125581962 [Brassica napus]|uniref:uncharacterized protein LOC125581962 n=1 Tax=Brassica napus TaxID=3708 RepID=UPI002078A956|nr:uncharacterized protein LOC125581962 [Brassica napus]XP_048604219.1 uncharacterized protein LOC125581962 [Brassica napus]
MLDCYVSGRREMSSVVVRSFNYDASHHQCSSAFKILGEAWRQIKFDEITKPISPLSKEGFRFRNQAELVGLANTNTQLPDIVGEITVVKSIVSELPEDKNCVMATIKMENDVSVTLSLFDSQVVALHKNLEDMHVDPKVIVATNINPKMVGGRLFLNATSETHIYFDRETSAGETCFYKDTGLLSVAPLLRAYAEVENVTMAELKFFIIMASSQEIDFLCPGRVSRVDTYKGWCYVACSKYSSKLHRSASAFECVSCSNSHAVGALRYRVELVVADDTGEGTFVCFDGVMA